MRKKDALSQLAIYKDKKGNIEFRTDISKETIWATQAQMAELFDIDQSVISRHVKTVFKDGEVNQKSNMQKMHITNSDRPIVLYSLDVVLAIGYKTNSKTAIEFRKWATKTLRSYIVDGFALNKKRIGVNYAKFINAVEDIKKLLPSAQSTNTGDVMELVSLFADTWLSLDAYDRGILPKGKQTKKKIDLTAKKISSGISQLKMDLLEKSEATDIFGVESSKGSIMGIVGNIRQSFDGKELYPTVEEKAAHLLYFIVKNHPFIDGNKRSGAFSFVWFLRQAGILDVARMTPQALTALTILVASSDPNEKDKIVGLVLSLITKR